MIPESRFRMDNTLIALLGNYGEHWRNLPVVGRTSSGDVIALFDHRMPIHDRICGAAQIAQRFGLTTIERVVMSPVPVDCDAGVHDWTAINGEAVTVAVRCRRCGNLERLDSPIPVVDLTFATVAS